MEKGKRRRKGSGGEGTGTCIHEAVVKMETEQGGSHPGLVRDRGLHRRLDGREGIRACCVIEGARQLSRSCPDKKQDED